MPAANATYVLLSATVGYAKAVLKVIEPSFLDVTKIDNRPEFAVRFSFSQSTTRTCAVRSWDYEIRRRNLGQFHCSRSAIPPSRHPGLRQLVECVSPSTDPREDGNLSCPWKSSVNVTPHATKSTDARKWIFCLVSLDVFGEVSIMFCEVEMGGISWRNRIRTTVSSAAELTPHAGTWVDAWRWIFFCTLKYCECVYVIASCQYQCRWYQGHRGMHDAAHKQMPNCLFDRQTERTRSLCW